MSWRLSEFVAAALARVVLCGLIVVLAAMAVARWLRDDDRG